MQHLRVEQPLKVADQRTLLLLATCAFASAASMRICDPLLPVLARDFDVVELPFPERGSPRLVKGGVARERRTEAQPAEVA